MIFSAAEPRLGVCYYPEHWPPTRWPEDARLMMEMGISVVRIGEFAWSRLEPRREAFDWQWLDQAIDTLAAAGLHVILGTPTACPPKWLVDERPEILPVDAFGHPRRFGSRRHYCFSSPAYRAEARRIVSALASRYGRHDAVVGWQIDNEFGCHDTVESFGTSARDAFRAWLQQRHGDIEQLNRAWGTVFWSQQYTGFEQIDPPAATVTEAHPAHRLDYRRFSSDQVVSFNREQAELLRARSPGRDLTHNFMGLFTDFDHFAAGADLDIAAWDSYPLGFLQQWSFDAADRASYRRQGHPDFAAFHHDLYRAAGRGRFAVMEQQPGPVNWASHNAAPLPGMVRLWLWEAIAHGAELASIFRWRRAPFAQEQMHAGLLTVDGREDRAAGELRRVHRELRDMQPLPELSPAPAALLFDYPSCWLTDIQPQSAGFSALRLALDCYASLRRAGLDVDIVAPGDDLAGYGLVVVPCLPVIETACLRTLEAAEAPVLFGPRCGSKTRHFAVPPEGEPGPLQRLLPLRVARVDSLAPHVRLGLRQIDGHVHTWLEELDTALAPRAAVDDGRGVWYSHGRRHYLAGWPDAGLLDRVIEGLCADAGAAPLPLPPGVRLRRRGDLTFVFNYADEPRTLAVDGRLLLGSERLAPADLAIWQR